MQKCLLSLSLTTLLVACGGTDQKNTINTTPVVDPPATSLFSAVRNAAQQELQSHVNSPAVSVAIYHQGDIVFAEAFGEKTLGGGETVGKDTLFQLGSVTKMFTALATLKLADQGQIQLTTPLVQTLSPMQYGSWQAQSWQDINLHHLLTHQSGLYDDYSDETINQSLLTAMRDSHTSDTQLMNPPGKFYNYSNPNFSYLGAIVEDQTHTDYRLWMQQEIFTPLNMPNTTMMQESVANYGDYALGVRVSGNQVFAAQTLPDIAIHPAAVPAGSYTWSTPSELLNMADLLFAQDSELLSKPLKDQMTKKHVRVDHNSHYGYGIEVSDGFALNGQWYNEEIWYHGGFTQDYRAAFLMLPQQQIAIAILNSGPDEFEQTLISALQAVTVLPPPQPLPTTTIDTASFEHHIGTYVDHVNELTFNVGLDNDNLSLHIPEFEQSGQAYSQELMALGNGLFMAETDGENFYFSFVADEGGGESVYMRSREAVGIKLGYSPWHDTHN